MHLKFEDINDAFINLVKLFHNGHDSIVKSESRNGSVKTIDEPMTITYRNPLRRVLLNPIRDTNPFFHVIEAMWMLAGRRDIAPLVHFNQEMAKFSDDGETSHAAYGDRWRNYFGMESGEHPWVPHDQLNDIIEILSKDKTSRRVVLEMWSNGDLRRQIEYPTAKDLPCNLLAMFRCRRDRSLGDNPPNSSKVVHYLDMTVVNRSNDMLLGMCGANYVHFSYLQEYIALGTGAAVGHYHQITNNLHVYTSPKEEGSPWLPGKCDPIKMMEQQSYYPQGYTNPALYSDRQEFDTVNKAFFERELWRATTLSQITEFYSDIGCQTSYFINVIFPLVLAFNAHKERMYDTARNYAAHIQPADWRADCFRWLNVRRNRYERSQNDGPNRSTSI